MGGASLKAAFVAPASLGLGLETRLEPYPRLDDANARHGAKARESKRKPAKVLVAASPDGKGGEFLVVMTLRRGDPPAVSVQGAGLGATVAVGRRVIRFNGTKVLVEDRSASRR
jgi:hypothetical protein